MKIMNTQEDITIAQDNRNIKKALQKQYPKFKVSVINGKGTAYGWKHITIITDIKERLDENGFLRYNDIEKAQLEQIRQVANKTILETGKNIYTYCDDMNQDHSEVLLQVEGIRS